MRHWHETVVTGPRTPGGAWMGYHVNDVIHLAPIAGDHRYPGTPGPCPYCVRECSNPGCLDTEAPDTR